MGQQQIAGLMGAGMIIGGVFSPILRGPIIGRVTYLDFSRGEAIVVAAFALIAAFLVLVLVLVGERRGDFTLGSIPVYNVSDRVYWRELESVQLNQARQGRQQ